MTAVCLSPAHLTTLTAGAHQIGALLAPSLVLGLGFITPAFFAAGAGLMSIPIIIHILNRRRFRIVHWAAMEYLLQAMRRNRRRVRFEQWLLLAARCCLLLLLGLALARPLGCNNSKLFALASQRNGLHAFIIDNSYPMAYEADRGNVKTHLDLAKALAKQYIDKLSSSGESVVLITAGRPATAILAKPSYNLDEVRAAIDRIPQSYSDTDMAGALQLAIQIAHDETKQAKRSLCIFTDNTRNAWEGAQASTLKDLSHQLPPLYGVPTVHCLGQADQWNQAILEVKPVQKLVTTKDNTDFTITARGFGAPPGSGPGSVVQLKIDGQVLKGAQPVKPDSQTPPIIVPNEEIKTGGPHVLTASLLNDDRLKIDNTRYHVMNVATQLKVLIVEGERGMGPLSGSGTVLSVALAPPIPPSELHPTSGPSGDISSDDSEQASRSIITPELISDLELNGKILPNYRAVILTDVASIDATEADQLQKYVSDGGTLMLFMGPQVNGEAYNNVLLGKMANGHPRQLLPGKLIKIVSSDQSADHKPFHFDFNPNGTLDAVLAPFRGYKDSGLGTADIYNYWQVELPHDSPVERVLNYVPTDSLPGHAAVPIPAEKPHADLGDPAITIHTVGRGRVVFYSTTAGTEWTTFPIGKNYLSLMHELLVDNVSPNDRWMNLIVGQPLRIPESMGLQAAPALLDPSRNPLAISAETTPTGGTIYGTRPLAQPGIYTLTAGQQTYPIAVNVPDDAADVRTIVPQGVKQAMDDIDVYLAGDSIPADAIARSQESDIGWTLMVLALCLAGFECFLAMHFGHQRREGLAAEAGSSHTTGAARPDALGARAVLDKRQKFLLQAYWILAIGAIWIVADIAAALGGMHVVDYLVIVPAVFIVVGIVSWIRFRRA